MIRKQKFFFRKWIDNKNFKHKLYLQKNSSTKTLSIARISYRSLQLILISYDFMQFFIVLSYCDLKNKLKNIFPVFTFSIFLFVDDCHRGFTFAEMWSCGVVWWNCGVSVCVYRIFKCKLAVANTNILIHKCNDRVKLTLLKNHFLYIFLPLLSILCFSHSIWMQWPYKSPPHFLYERVLLVSFHLFACVESEY